MITIPGNVRVWLATGHTDMRRGFRSLALMVQEELKRDPHCGDLCVVVDVRPDQNRLAGWRRCVSVLEAARPQTLLVADDGGRRRHGQRCSAPVSLVRDRLADATRGLAAASGGMKIACS